jgi:hypothetical protein
MRHNGHRAPEEIQADIERTRGDLDETLSALESRLTPGQLMDQSWSYLRNSGAREYVQRLGETVKEDPVPLALVGVGLAWLMLSDRGRSRRPLEADHSGELTAAMEGKAAAIKETAASVKDSVGHTTQKVSDTVQAARAKASQVADTAREQADRLRGGYQQVVAEQPLALGAVGLAIGAVLGALAPRTRQEDRILGPARDRLKEELIEAGREPMQRMATAASAAADAAMDALSSGTQEQSQRGQGQSSGQGQRGQGPGSQPSGTSETSHPRSPEIERESRKGVPPRE